LSLSKASRESRAPDLVPYLFQFHV
jgi:hypothetical protein